MESKKLLLEIQEEVQRDNAWFWKDYERQTMEIHKYDERFNIVLNDLNQLEKAIEEIGFLERKNDDLWETIKTLSRNATIQRNRFGGTEITIKLNSHQDDFDKIAWIFGCQRG
jgi:hypothetical protein